MRILLICQQALRPHAVPAYSFWEHYLKEGLTEGGHSWIEVPQVDWAEGLTHMAKDQRLHWLDTTWSAAISFLKSEQAKAPVDFVLCYLFPFQIEISAVETMRSTGVPVVNFFCDNVREFERVPQEFLHFDLHWVPEYEALPIYQAAGCRHIHAPMPVWIPPTQRTDPEQEVAEVTFIGSHDVLREALFSRAARPGLPLRVRGQGWTSSYSDSSSRPWLGGNKLANQLRFVRNYGLRGLAVKLTYKLRRQSSRDYLSDALRPAVSVDDYFRISRESAVTLGVNRYPSFRHSFQYPHAYSRLRDIEAPMLGACYLTESAPGLDRLYELGKEIEIYRTADELAAKAKELLADPIRRLGLRKNGQRRALSDHTIDRSIGKIAKILDLV